MKIKKTFSRLAIILALGVFFTSCGPDVIIPLEVGVPSTQGMEAFGINYYSFRTEPTQVPYNIRLYNNQSDMGWQLHLTDAFTTYGSMILECDNTMGASSESCNTPPLYPNTMYFIQVDSYDWFADSFTILITAL